MSLWEDFDGQFERDHPFGMPSKYWQSKNGKIAVKDMSDGYIKNCMNIVGEDDNWYWYFMQELRIRETTRKMNGGGE